MDEIRKSINSILYERATSPFFGTLILSWIIWNWKIVYLTIFVSEESISQNKIVYITENLTGIHFLITYPLVSTLILITLIPFISNGAYWLSIKFRKWRIDQKNEVEKKLLLTLEQSIELREEIRRQEKRFDELLEDKNLQIEQLTKSLNDEDKKKQDQSKDENSINNPRTSKKDTISENEIKEFFASEYNIQQFEQVVWKIQNGSKMFSGHHPDSKFISFLESNELIEGSNGIYKFTNVGKRYLKFYSHLTMKK